tara:strand:+ start:1019 stop:2203 length:1185 start_codon:yes stop_codon:yes gene_type:complete
MSGSVGNASDFIRGITFKPNELIAVEADDAIVCMRTKNVQKDLDDRDLIAVPSRLVRNKEKLLRHGDILISSANSWELVGKCSYVGELAYPATAGGFIAIVRPKKHTHPRYLYHWLTSPKTQHKIRHCGRQTTNISNLDVGRFKELPFPEFEFDEQRRIAALLDKADAIRRKRQQVLALADDFLKSVFLEMFGDPVRNPFEIEQKLLGKCADFVSGGTPSKRNPIFWNGAFPWVSPKDMKVETILDAQDHVSASVFEETSLKRIPAGTPLIVVRGMILAHTVPMAMAGVEVAINQDMKGILFNEDINPVFGLWCLRVQHQHILDQVDTAAHGTKRLDMDRLKAIPIHVPGDNQQQKFVGIVEKFSEIRKSKQTALNEATDMFSALSQRAFRGEL